MEFLFGFSPGKGNYRYHFHCKANGGEILVAIEGIVTGIFRSGRIFVKVCRVRGVDCECCKSLYASVTTAIEERCQ